MVDFGQVVIGPPGSGKTTYCEGMRQLLSGLGRPHLVINLDFANDGFSRPSFNPPDVDVRNLLTIESVMADKNLGPNGGLVFCMRALAANTDWLKDEINKAKKGKGYSHGVYMLIDMPGQVELYTNDTSLCSIVKVLNDRERGLRLVCVHLVDSTLCTSPANYLSALLISLCAQMFLEYPFLNLFSKTDILNEDDLKKNHNLSMEYMAKCEDLEYIIPIAHQPIPSVAQQTNLLPGVRANLEKENKFAEFHRAVIGLVEDFSLTSFLPLDIQDKDSAFRILAMCDHSCGFSMSAYIPPHLRLPGSATAGDETRIECDLEKRIVYGDSWFDK